MLPSELSWVASVENLSRCVTTSCDAVSDPLILAGVDTPIPLFPSLSVIQLPDALAARLCKSLLQAEAHSGHLAFQRTNLKESRLPDALSGHQWKPLLSADA